MMYLDANFFMFASFDEGVLGDRARKVMVDIHKGKRACTSPLSIDEFMWIVIKNKKKEELRNLVEGIYRLKNLEVRPVSPLVPLRAMTIMEGFGLKPRDAFHVAVMQEFGIEEIISDDSDFDRVPMIRRTPI